MSRKAGKILSGLGDGLNKGLNMYNEISAMPEKLENARIDREHKIAQTEWLRSKAAEKVNTTPLQLPSDFSSGPALAGLEGLGATLSQAMEGTGALPKTFTPNRGPSLSTLDRSNLQLSANEYANNNFGPVAQLLSQVNSDTSAIAGTKLPPDVNTGKPPADLQALLESFTSGVKGVNKAATAGLPTSKGQMASQKLQELIQQRLSGGAPAVPSAAPVNPGLMQAQQILQEAVTKNAPPEIISQLKEKIRRLGG